jgi:acylphosphatase
VQRIHAFVHGDVQGVGFRYFVIDVARPLGVSGWVRNRSDGSVEITAEGERHHLEALVEAARRGPRGAQVERVEAKWEKAAGNLGPFRLVY